MDDNEDSLVQIDFSLSTKVDVSVVLDRGSYYSLDPDQIRDIAIAKARQSKSRWDCQEKSVSGFNPKEQHG